MNILKQIFADPRKVSQELSEEELILQKDLAQFFQSYKIKQEVLDRLLSGDPIGLHISKLQWALTEEIALIEAGERAEHEIIGDLKYLSRDAYIAKLEDLERAISQTKEKDKYVEKLLDDLREVLLAQARKVRRIRAGDDSPEIVDSLTSLLMIEKDLVEKLSLVEDLRGFFSGLAIGERREYDLHDAEKRLARKLFDRMRNIMYLPDGTVQSTDGHYLSELTARIFNRLEHTIMESVRVGQITAHSYVDLEFVNSPLFEQFVRNEIGIDQSMGKIVPSEKTLLLFVQIFRELYNAQLMPSARSSPIGSDSAPSPQEPMVIAQ